MNQFDSNLFGVLLRLAVVINLILLLSLPSNDQGSEPTYAVSFRNF